MVCTQAALVRCLAQQNLSGELCCGKGVRFTRNNIRAHHPVIADHIVLIGENGNPALR